jgi:hypothetical protein
LQKKKLLKLLVSLCLACVLATLLLLLSETQFYQSLELKTFDARFIIRGLRLPKAPVLLIDIDDQSLDRLGRWPWPRSLHARLIDILSECGARQVIMDVLFTEKLQDKPEDDVLFADALSRSGRVYLPFYFTEEAAPPSPAIKELLLKDISVTAQDAALALGVKPDSLKDSLPLAKRYVIDEVVRDILRKNPDSSIEALLSAIEDTHGWFLFAAEEGYIRESFENKRLSRLFTEKFSLADKGLRLKESKNFIPPIREYIEGIKGSGFINANPDQDGVMRKVPLFIKHQDRMFPQVSVAALLDFLEVKDVQGKEGWVTLKGARKEGIGRDIKIPVDGAGCMLINWSGRWNSTFEHVPYYLVV